MDHKTYSEITGIVIRSVPVGESDRRVVLLTREMGKIAAFARGLRRQNSPLMGAVQPFNYGSFRIYAGRDYYVLTEARIDQHFDALKKDVTLSCYGSYFLEVMDELTRENNDESRLLLLTYAALRALEKKALDPKLVRAIFEIRCAVEEGEFSLDPAFLSSLLPRSDMGRFGFPNSLPAQDRDGSALQDETVEAIPGITSRALEMIASSDMAHLFSFSVSEETLKQLLQISSRLLGRLTSHEFTSLKILNMLV